MSGNRISVPEHSKAACFVSITVYLPQGLRRNRVQQLPAMRELSAARVIASPGHTRQGDPSDRDHPNISTMAISTPFIVSCFGLRRLFVFFSFPLLPGEGRRREETHFRRVFQTPSVRLASAINTHGACHRHAGQDDGSDRGYAEHQQQGNQ